MPIYVYFDHLRKVEIARSYSNGSLPDSFDLTTSTFFYTKKILLASLLLLVVIGAGRGSFCSCTVWGEKWINTGEVNWVTGVRTKLSYYLW